MRWLTRRPRRLMMGATVAPGGGDRPRQALRAPDMPDPILPAAAITEKLALRPLAAQRRRLEAMADAYRLSRNWALGEWERRYLDWRTCRGCQHRATTAARKSAAVCPRCGGDWYGAARPTRNALTALLAELRRAGRSARLPSDDGGRRGPAGADAQSGGRGCRGRLPPMGGMPSAAATSASAGRGVIGGPPGPGSTCTIRPLASMAGLCVSPAASGTCGSTSRCAIRPRGSCRRRVVREASGRWHVCVVRKLTRRRRVAPDVGVVGVDPGAKVAVTCSTGDEVDPVRLRDLRRLRRLQRRVSWRRGGAKGRASVGAVPAGAAGGGAAARPRLGAAAQRARGRDVAACRARPASGGRRRALEPDRPCWRPPQGGAQPGHRGRRYRAVPPAPRGEDGGAGRRRRRHRRTLQRHRPVRRAAPGTGRCATSDAA